MGHPEMPQNIEAEKATLGAVLLNREALVPVATWLKPEYFYLEQHRQIYSAMLVLHGQRTPPDFRTVAIELKKQGQLDSVGGPAYLASLTDETYSAHIQDYAREVERTALLRQVIMAGVKITALGYDTGRGAADVIGDAQQELAQIAGRTVQGGLTSFATLADRQYERTEMGSVLGLPTGYRDLDEITGGLQDEDLIILAARPSVGKTAFLMNLACNIATSRRGDVLIFSLEMSEDQLLARAASMHSRVDLLRIRRLRMGEQDMDAYMSALVWAGELPIFVDDTAAVPTSHIRNAVLRHQSERDKPAIVMVDYLQLMAAPGKREGNRVQEVSEISRSLKALAKEIGCPVLALSQLSRAVEGRTSHVPMLSDLRESGSIEQDADLVMFIYREELYDRETDKKGIAELHIAKHRNGPIGVIPMRFDAATTCFADLTYRTPMGYSDDD